MKSVLAIKAQSVQVFSEKIAETCRVHAGQHKACSSSSEAAKQRGNNFESQKIPTAHSETHTSETLTLA